MNEGTDAIEMGAGVRKGSKGSRGVDSGREDEEEEKEEDEETEAAEEQPEVEEKEEDEREGEETGEECNKNASKRERGPGVVTELNDTSHLLSGILDVLGAALLFSCDEEDRSKVVSREVVLSLLLLLMLAIGTEKEEA